MTDPARWRRLPAAFACVAAAWRRTSTIGQQPFDDVLYTHPDIAALDRAGAAWGRKDGQDS